jgi:hypothetical protein
MTASRTTFASRFLARHPELRRRIESAPDFVAWRDRFKRVVIDGVEYHVVGGDMLRDADEMMLDWARQSGMVGQDDVDRLRREEDRPTKGKGGGDEEPPK